MLSVLSDVASRLCCALFVGGALFCAAGCGQAQPEPVSAHGSRAQLEETTVKKPSHRSGFVSCDANVRVKKRTTSCAFAENVFWSYWTFENTDSLDVWSPTVQETFRVHCAERGRFVRCTTDSDGDIRIRQSALDEYSEVAADNYGSSHDLGPDPYENNSLSSAGADDAFSDGDDEGSGDIGSNCEPGYDPCLESGVGDYDCDGGYGNGPNYTGTVEVTGSDPFDLDRDGDGVGCE